MLCSQLKKSCHEGTALKTPHVHRDMTGVQHHQRSLQAPGDCMSWRKTSFYGSWQDRFRLIFVPEATIATELVWSVPISRSIIYATCYYILWIILEDDWFLIFHDNLQQFLEASQRQKCLTTSPGSTWGTLATLAAGQRGTLWHGQPGSLRSWNPSVSWREIFRRFFLAFQSGKDEIPLVQMKMERHGHWGNGCKVMSCDSCVSETESQCKWFSRKAWNTYKYKRHINVFICTKMCTMMCSIKIALTLGVHRPRGMVMDLVKFIVFLDQAIKKWVAKVDATHHTSRIALQIWSDGGADPLEVLNLPTHSWTWS